MTVPPGPLNSLTNGFTIEAWVMPRDTDKVLRVLGSRGQERGQGIGFGVAKGRIRLTVCRIKDYDTTDPVVEAGKWQHIAAALDDTNSCEFFLNGESLGRIEGKEPALPTPAELKLGQSGDATNSETWSGYLDEIRVWDHARTQEQIVRGICQALDGSEDGLVAYFPFDEGTGNVTASRGQQKVEARLQSVGWVEGPPIVGRGAADGRDIIIESRSQGQNHALYSEISGSWQDSNQKLMAKSSAPGLTPDTKCGSRKLQLKFKGTTFENTQLGAAKFTPKVPKLGYYYVYATWPYAANCRYLEFHVTHALGTTMRVLTQNGWGEKQPPPCNSNAWNLVGGFWFRPGDDQHVEMRITARSGAFFIERNGLVYSDAMRFCAWPLEGESLGKSVPFNQRGASISAPSEVPVDADVE